jgi:hypothetical protein
MITTGIAGSNSLNPLQELDAVHSGKANIAEYHVGMHGRQKLQRPLRISRDLAFVAVLGEERLHRAREVALVVNDEDG